jgi:hypothetical protein
MGNFNSIVKRFYRGKVRNMATSVDCYNEDGTPCKYNDCIGKYEDYYHTDMPSKIPLYILDEREYNHVAHKHFLVWGIWRAFAETQMDYEQFWLANKLEEASGRGSTNIWIR